MLTSTRETVRAEQLKQLSEDELKQLESLVKPNVNIRRLSRDEIVKAIRKAAAGLFERESVVTQDKLLAEILNTSLGSFDLGELKAVLSDLPELKHLGGEAVNPFYSPEEVIERETRSIESVEDQDPAMMNMNGPFSHGAVQKNYQSISQIVPVLFGVV